MAPQLTMAVFQSRGENDLPCTLPIEFHCRLDDLTVLNF